MRSWSITLIRAILNTFLILTVIATALGHWQPQPMITRTLAIPIYQPIQKNPSIDSDPRPLMLNSTTGKLERMEISDPDILETGSCSPWVDNYGRHHIVGQWTRRSKSLWNPKTIYGLARFAIPGGELLDYLELDVTVAAPPYWASDTSGRILWAGSDRHIYTYQFSQQRDANPYREPRPSSEHKLRWGINSPKEADFIISYVTGIDHPRFHNLIVVCASDLTGVLRPSSEAMTPLTPPRPTLWWLQLNREHDTVIGAGPLFGELRTLNLKSEDILPSLGVTRDGQLILAYLHREQIPEEHRLCVAPVKIDEHTETPWVDLQQTREVPGYCSLNAPIFCPDGENLFVMHRSKSGLLTPVKHHLNDILAPLSYDSPSPGAREANLLCE